MGHPATHRVWVGHPPFRWVLNGKLWVGHPPVWMGTL